MSWEDLVNKVGSVVGEGVKAGHSAVSEAIKNKQIENDFFAAKKLVLMGLNEALSKKLCQANDCTPSNEEYNLLNMESKRIRLSKVDYAKKLASEVSSDDLLRQLPNHAQKDLQYQISEIKKKWKIDEYADKPKAQVIETVENADNKPAEVVQAEDKKFDLLVDAICRFRPPLRMSSEKDYENSLYSYLLGVLPTSRIENQYKLGDTRCDLKVDEYVLELKRRPSGVELHRLFEQIARYSKYRQFSKIVIVIFDADVQATSIFCDTLMQNPVIDRITVIGDYRIFMKDGKRR